MNHPNIVRLLGIYVHDVTNQKYIVTEYMSKGSLLSVLRSEQEKITATDLLGM